MSPTKRLECGCGVDGYVLDPCAMHKPQFLTDRDPGNEDTEHTPAEELPTLASLRGALPNLTGGLSSEEYVRRIRDNTEPTPTGEADEAEDTEAICAVIMQLLGVDGSSSPELLNLVAGFAMRCENDGGRHEKLYQRGTALEFKLGLISDRRAGPTADAALRIVVRWKREAAELLARMNQASADGQDEKARWGDEEVRLLRLHAAELEAALAARSEQGAEDE